MWSSAQVEKRETFTQVAFASVICRPNWSGNAAYYVILLGNSLDSLMKSNAGIIWMQPCWTRWKHLYLSPAGSIQERDMQN